MNIALYQERAKLAWLRYEAKTQAEKEKLLREIEALSKQIGDKK